LTFNSPTGKRGRLAWLFAALVLISFALFMFPAFIIQPFRMQTPRMLAAAMVIRTYAPWLTLFASLGALWITVRLWSGIRVWKRALLVLGLIVAGFGAVMSRIDYFEWMFHPITSAGFESANDAKLDGSEMVMAVRFGDQARAYPIRAMAYHHILNDVVGGVPIVATY